MTYEKAKEILDKEAGGHPSKRTQPVPCAYCVRGGNGEKDCGCGGFETKYSKYKGCFSGELLAHAPGSLT